MTNHEITLELIKQILPNLLKCYEHNLDAQGYKPDGYTAFITTAFNSVLSALPPQDAGKIQSE